MRRSPHASTLRATDRALPLVTALALALAGCTADEPAAPPDRPADVAGTVDRDDRGPRLVDASDPYYEGMALLSASTVVLDADGGRVDGDALDDGDVVEAWADVCAESFPVQCQVLAVRRSPRMASCVRSKPPSEAGCVATVQRAENHGSISRRGR
ncbi:hypothetical protein [Cellulosimicrobium sp. NPDC057862]|uniref:hypothetical protein n=1 Tax=Cellulosimicrobium sp. NPDC057862 TaxID=3346266 RepID=UPI003671A8D0